MNKTLRNILLKLPSWIMSIVCVALILWLTLIPRPLGEFQVELFPNADKVVHAIMFGGLTFCIFVDVWRKNRFKLPSGKVQFAAIMVAVILGGVIELVQGGMGFGREADIVDFIADIIGVLTVSLGLSIIKYFYGR